MNLTVISFTIIGLLGLKGHAFFVYLLKHAHQVDVVYPRAPFREKDIRYFMEKLESDGLKKANIIMRG